MPSVAELLATCLRAQGARRLFGDIALPGLSHVPVADAPTARLLADADGRLGPGAGVALSGSHLRVSSHVGAVPDVLVVDDPADLPSVIARWAMTDLYGAVALDLRVDLAAPAPEGAEPLAIERRPGRTVTLAPDLAALGVLVLAGPGVVRAGRVPDLQRMAARGGFGVVNTWGAKGVFPWDDPHHFGTAGLQARDFELAGLLDAGVIVAVGIDPDEAPAARWSGAQVLEVDPEQLEALTLSWDAPAAVPPRPRLYLELSAAVGPLYQSTSVPLNPARAAAGLAAVRPVGGLVAADPGPAGLWVARAFPTTEPGSVVVPATPARGFAAAAALVAALDERPAIAVTTAPLDDETHAVLELARALGLPLVLEVWGDGEAADADAQLDRTSAALASGTVAVEHYPVDFTATEVLVDVAGDVVAWGST